MAIFFINILEENMENAMWKQELMLRSKFKFGVSLVKWRSNYGIQMKKMKTSSWNNVSRF